jgi:hypothetical protein
MALGYLNQAIEDLRTNLRAGRGIVGLMAAPIAGVERYGGARPNFSLRPDQPPRPQRGGNLRHGDRLHLARHQGDEAGEIGTRGFEGVVRNTAGF